MCGPSFFSGNRLRKSDSRYPFRSVPNVPTFSDVGPIRNAVSGAETSAVS